MGDGVIVMVYSHPNLQAELLAGFDSGEQGRLYVGLFFDEPPPKQSRCAKTGRFKAVPKRHPIIIGNPTSLINEKPR